VDDQPSGTGEPEKYVVDASGAQGVQIGAGNRQTNFITNFYDGKSRPTVITGKGAEESPYLGLNAFGEDDAALFFGRDAVAADILERLRRCLDDLFLGVSGHRPVGSA
jgi:hypothetical protein